MVRFGLCSTAPQEVLDLTRIQMFTAANPGAGITMVAPWEVQPRLPITMP